MIAAVEAERMAEAALAETPVSTDTVSGEVADSLKNAGLIARFGEFAPCAEGSLCSVAYFISIQYTSQTSHSNTDISGVCSFKG